LRSIYVNTLRSGVGFTAGGKVNLDKRRCSMADEEKKCCNTKKTLSTLFKVVLGVVFLVLGGLAVLKWWKALLLIIKGGIGLLLILAGVITLAIAKE